MNMERILFSYSQLPDSDVLNTLWLLLVRYCEAKRKLSISKKLTRRIPNNNSLKHFPSIQLPDRSSPRIKRILFETVISKRVPACETPKSKTSPFCIDQILTLNSIFSKIAENYEQSVWVRRSSTYYTEIHVALFKQVLFDCYLTDRKLLELILEPIRKSCWIGSENFIKCLEEIHLGMGWKLFSPTKNKKHENNNFRKQNLICKNYLVFFALVMIEKGDDLDRESLKRALNLAEKQSFFQLEFLADLYITKAKNEKSGRCKISFENFYNVVINLDLTRV